MRKIQNLQKGIIYSRISTDKQDINRQVADCLKYAQDAGIAITQTISETISSRKTDREIFSVIDSLKAGDCLIVTELSRLGRSMIELNNIISTIIQKKAVLHVVSGSVHVVDDSPLAQMFVFTSSLAAQAERDLISERTISALKARKAAGVKLGRPEGTRKAKENMLKCGVDEKIIRTMVKAGASMASIGRVLHVDARTVEKFIKTL